MNTELNTVSNELGKKNWEYRKCNKSLGKN